MEYEGGVAKGDGLVVCFLCVAVEGKVEPGIVRPDMRKDEVSLRMYEVLRD